MSRWRIEDSAELYNITGWGLKYFSINDNGHVQVTPREGCASVDLKELMDELQIRDITAPVLLRFPDILDNRIEKISRCFKQAAEEYKYGAQNFIIYPIKVNQMQPVVEEIISHGRKFNLGLEAGSKPELHAVIALQCQCDSLIICNGYKDQNYIELALLAQKMGKKRVIAETGAGQHGVATATVAALMNMECVVYMGKEDCERQALNVFRMELLGAKVVPVSSGTGTLKDAVNEALRVWTERVEDTYYVLGSVMGPHPYPEIVRDFQKIIGEEIKAQMLEKEGRLPDVLVACVGGGSNAMGMFYDFIEDKDVRLIGVEAAGLGVDNPKNAATMANGKLGIFHGMKSYFLQDEYGQIAPVYSISAGLDYPGIGPEHAYLHDIGRAEYVPATDKEAVDAFNYLSKTEGIIPAIESAHAVAYAMKLAPTLPKDKIMVINISGRGDKDVAAIARYMGVDLHE